MNRLFLIILVILFAFIITTVALPVSLIDEVIDDILKLKKAGLDDDTIAAYVSKQRLVSAPTTDQIIQLTKAGVGSETLKALINSSKSTHKEPVEKDYHIATPVNEGIIPSTSNLVTSSHSQTSYGILFFRRPDYHLDNNAGLPKHQVLNPVIDGKSYKDYDYETIEVHSKSMMEASREWLKIKLSSGNHTIIYEKKELKTQFPANQPPEVYSKFNFYLRPNQHIAIDWKGEYRYDIRFYECKYWKVDKEKFGETIEDTRIPQTPKGTLIFYMNDMTQLDWQLFIDGTQYSHPQQGEKMQISLSAGKHTVIRKFVNRKGNVVEFKRNVFISPNESTTIDFNTSDSAGFGNWILNRY